MAAVPPPAIPGGGRPMLLADAPPPAACRDGPLLLTDLPLDVLSHILSLIPLDAPFKDRFTPALACKALAAAVRGPSAVWSNVSIPEVVSGAGRPRILTNPRSRAAAVAFERALAQAAPSVRSLELVAMPSRDGPDVSLALAPAVPFVDDLHLYIDSMDDMDVTLGGALAGIESASYRCFEPMMAAATRCSYLRLGHWSHFIAPAPVLTAARDAVIAYGNGSEYYFRTRSEYDTTVALFRSMAAAAAAVSPSRVGGPGPVRLKAVNPMRMPWNTQERALQFVREVVVPLGWSHSLIWLSISRDERAAAAGTAPPEDAAIVKDLLGHLPLLTDLAVECIVPAAPGGVRLDWRGIATPPCGLTLLSLHVTLGCDVFLPRPIIASLAELMVEVRPCPGPPTLLSGAGAAFTRLTRLVYGQVEALRHDPPTDLAPWSLPEFTLPFLKNLEVIHWAFQLRRASGRDWAAAVATATLPRLELLELSWHKQEWRDQKEPFVACPEGTVAQVKEAVYGHLRAAAAAAGRELTVRVSYEEDERTFRGEMGRSESMTDSLDGRLIRKFGIGLVYERVRG